MVHLQCSRAATASPNQMSYRSSLGAPPPSSGGSFSTASNAKASKFSNCGSSSSKRPKARKVDLLYKSEMCKSITDGRACTFHTNCKFAHTKEELRYPTFKERDAVGLIPQHLCVETYRSYPCLDHAATGCW